MKTLKLLALVGALAVIGAAPAQANLIVNGDFMANAPSFTVWPGDIGNGTNPTSITGWATFPGDAGKGLNGAGTGFPLNATSPFGPTNPGGTTYAFLQGEGNAIYQNLTALINQTNTTYTLSIDIAGRAGDVAPAFSVEFADANTPFTPFWVNGGFGPAIPGNQANFQNYTLNFTTPATGLSNGVLIELWNRSGAGDNTVDFANVSVTAVVPEPTTVALVGLGIVLAGVGRGSRRHTAY